MVAYLAVESGREKGRKYYLDGDRPLHLGRALSCELILSDPVCSRFHAVVYWEDQHWQIRDSGSRNGTLVNGQKIDTALLIDGTVIQIGASVIRMVENITSDEDEFLTAAGDASISYTPPEHDPLRHLRDAGHLIDLYELSLEMLQVGNPEQIMKRAVELLREKVHADVIALSYQEGKQGHQPHLVEPIDQAESLKPPQAILRRVVKEGRALWIGDKHSPNATPDLPNRSPWSDAIFIPLESSASSVAILQLYRHQPSFTETDFQVALAAAKLLAAGLDRSLQHDSLRVQAERTAKRNADTNELIGDSPVMQTLKDRIVRVARANGCVLVRGESGCGKELVARALHRNSHRAKRPMLSVNCAAIPAELVESQLFGHAKGAFTGAESDHEGWFKQAHTGTLFLDEIGELPLEGQAKLLRILEGHPFQPVGSTQQVTVDVRIIAATNRDLAQLVREKRFREDLLYRLSVFELQLPPLRERGGDLDELIDHFIEHFRLQNGRPQIALSPEARAKMQEYNWPGNVRQLRNVIDSAVVMAETDLIQPADLGLFHLGEEPLSTLRIDHWERHLIVKAMERSAGSVPKAAALLGISRATAYRKLSEYAIDRE